MPKSKSKKRHTGPKPATSAAQHVEAVDEPAVERVQLLDDGVEQDDTWIVGDSLVHWAGLTAAARDKNLGVGGVSIGWHGVRGMKWGDFISYVQLLRMSNSAPRTVLVHLGGKDFEKSSKCQIHNLIKKC